VKVYISYLPPLPIVNALQRSYNTGFLSPRIVSEFKSADLCFLHEFKNRLHSRGIQVQWHRQNLPSNLNISFAWGQSSASYNILNIIIIIVFRVCDKRKDFEF